MDWSLLMHVSFFAWQLYSANATVCAPADGVLQPGVHRFRFGFTLPAEFIPSVNLTSYVPTACTRKPQPCAQADSCFSRLLGGGGWEGPETN